MKTLQLNQMEKFIGGIPVEQYCAELLMIINNGGGTPDSGFWYGFWNCEYHNQ